MGRITLLLLLSMSLPAAAESAKDYREAFLATCVAERDDRGVCSCTFDRWVEQMDNPQAPGAVIAARLVSQGSDARPSGYEAQQAAPYISQIASAGTGCAQDLYADQYQQTPPQGAPAQDDTAQLQEAEQDAEQSGGLLGGLLGVAKGVGQKAVKDTGNVLGKFNPFGGKSAAEDDTALTERPVPDYQPLFADYCLKNIGDQGVCGCRWDTLTATLNNVDTPQTRTVAYMASHEPGDMNIPEGVDRDKAFATYLRFSERAASCDS